MREKNKANSLIFGMTKAIVYQEIIKCLEWIENMCNFSCLTFVVRLRHWSFFINLGSMPVSFHKD
jgi:hypothetical protein